MLSILVDASFLFALLSTNDKEHSRAIATVRAHSDAQFLIAEIVMAETAYMVRKRISTRAAVRVARTLAHSSMELIHVTKPDLMRAADIMEKYHESEFDLADACLMALSERLGVTHVATYDRRDFGVFRPAHLDYLTLLP